MSDDEVLLNIDQSRRVEALTHARLVLQARSGGFGGTWAPNADELVRVAIFILDGSDTLDPSWTFGTTTTDLPPPFTGHDEAWEKYGHPILEPQVMHLDDVPPEGEE